jgi:hypothetical protein
MPGTAFCLQGGRATHPSKGSEQDGWIANVEKRDRISSSKTNSVKIVIGQLMNQRSSDGH